MSVCLCVCVCVCVSCTQELRYPGIVINAAMLVMGTAASLLFAYQAKLINVTDNFRNGEGHGNVLRSTHARTLAHRRAHTQRRMHVR